MKKIFAAILCLVMALGASAQVSLWDGSAPSQRLSFGARAGMNISEINVDGTDTKFGFFGGLGVDINIVNSFSINSGLFFTQKGAKESGALDWDDSPIHAKLRMTVNFIEIPVYASYRIRFNKAHMSQIFFGPYFDFGVYGKATAEVKSGGEKESDSVGLFNDENGFRRFQCGLGIGVAHTWNRFSVGLSFQGGLTDVSDGFDAEWNNFNVSVGYNF